MTPPISKDWWLAAALSTATVPATMAQSPAAAGAANRTGVVTAVAPGGKVTGNNELMVVGSNIVPGQRLRTDAGGPMHVLFMDQSALTLGPDAELTIDEFTFDPGTRQGRIRLGLVKGVVRVVGGQISKNTATTITTAHGKIEILGGITVVETNGSNTSGTFLFGQGMQVTDNSGNTQTVTRAGFGASIVGNTITTPTRTPVNELNRMLQRLESSPPAGNMASNPPPAPPGQLLSTGNTPGGANNPGATLANDRLKNVVDTNTNANPSNTLRALLGTGLVQNQS